MKKTKESYERYMASDAWSAKKRQYRNSGRPVECLVCGAKDYHLHHRTYVRFGVEHLDDLVPLCQEHHSNLHEYQRFEKLTVEVATKRYLAEPNQARRERRYPSGGRKGKPSREMNTARKVARRKAQEEQARRDKLGLGPIPIGHVEPQRTATGAIRSSGQAKIPKNRRRPRT